MDYRSDITSSFTKTLLYDIPLDIIFYYSFFLVSYETVQRFVEFSDDVTPFPAINEIKHGRNLAK